MSDINENERMMEKDVTMTEMEATLILIARVEMTVLTTTTIKTTSASMITTDSKLGKLIEMLKLIPVDISKLC